MDAYRTASQADEQWTKSISSKGMGQINVVRAALPFIADKGSFTLVSGVLTDEYMHGGTIGTTVNHLVEGFVKAAAVELPRGIRINAVCPGTIETPMVAEMIARGELDVQEATKNEPIGRLGGPVEIAAVVLWLCSPGASFVIGVALPVDGGYTAR